MVGLRQAQAFHTNTDPKGQPLSPTEREKLLKPYLPPQPNKATRQNRAPSNDGPRFHHRQRVRPAMRQLIHLLLFNIVHIVFSIYVRLRQIYHALYDRVCAILYYHHRTPELIRKDVRPLSRVPQHLSVILDMPPEGGKKDTLETLLNDACELAAWSASAGIPMLSIYEKSGELTSERLPNYHSLIFDQVSSNLLFRTSIVGSHAPLHHTTALRVPTNLPSPSGHPTCPPTALPTLPNQERTTLRATSPLLTTSTFSC